ncbi:MAG TPA: hypothetical protein VGP76_00230 [Planctomycetaceae bacterium]|jgi:hypothetical protein|nr:hypothetical protein [Planctomycetaceae bacterium]
MGRGVSVLVAAIAGGSLLFSAAHQRAAGKEKEAASQDQAVKEVSDALDRHLLDSIIPLEEVQAFISSHIPPMPEVRTVGEWEQYAQRARAQALERAVFRGEAARWRELPTRPVWGDTIAGGPGYRIKKLRYEAVPGLWIPALLYEPTVYKEQKVPVSLAVNGHEPKGKFADYKQIRCINQAKRGMIVLNMEYLGMGELTGPDFDHGRMNQIDLCGTSGVATFYLAMSRGLDILLAHEHADAARVAVQGLSGGGWQTITISAFDTRVTLTNPVAGYSSLQTRVRYGPDLGDSEQNPVDLETVVDYSQMTALLAPRAALLTYNFKDNCCFKADHALPPLVGAAEPIYQLYGKPNHLRTHVNHDPGNHNYGLDNRQQFYGMLKDFFFPSRSDLNATEIPSEKEVKTADELRVGVPADNLNFNSLARKLAAPLPHDSTIPTEPAERPSWLERRRALLRETVHAHTWALAEMAVGAEKVGPWNETDYWLRIGGLWTVPATELAPATPKGNRTVIVLADGGRVKAADEVMRLLKKGERVLAVDLFYFGESKIRLHSDLFAIAVSSVGERPLGIESSQLAAIARWVHKKHGAPPRIVAIGPRSSLIALVAAGLEATAIGEIDLQQPLDTLKDVIKKNMTLEQAPELFCFGLLERFDVPQLFALARLRRFVETGSLDDFRPEGKGPKSKAKRGSKH